MPWAHFTYFGKTTRDTGHPVTSYTTDSLADSYFETSNNQF